MENREPIGSAKTLPERLRTYVDECYDEHTYPSTIAALHENVGCLVKDEMMMFLRWANEIENCYLPRPRFEDGAVVKVGDYVDGLEGEVESYDVGESCRWTIYDDYDQIEGSGPVKRPDVLDADGVPIKVGDTVYWSEKNDENLPWEVTRIENGKVTVKAGTWIVEDNDPDEFTHREPDTQEKIDADARKAGIDYWGCDKFSCSECPAKIDGKTPDDYYGVEGCGPAKAVDLLRRQRELDKRNAK